MSYITQTVDEFFAKLDKMQRDLERFSQNLDRRSEQIPSLLKTFEQTVFTAGNKKISGNNAVERAAQKSLDNMRAVVETWRDKIEADRKGKQFIAKHEKFLVVMIFGAVKAGKSTLGNFIAGKSFFDAPFDNRYKKIPKPIFETEESARDTGGIEVDSSGDTRFRVDHIDTTGAIQYFTLSGLRWMDSPGTGAVGKSGDTKDMTALVDEYLRYIDMCIFLMNSAQPGLRDDMAYIQKLNRDGQDALIVITRSDFKSEDEDDNGNMTQTLCPKSAADRKLQEDDICKRLKATYPDIDENKFRAISVSTALAEEAVTEQNDDKFRDSNLDKLMQILGDKISDNAIARKQENPRRLLNGFVDAIVDDLKNFDADLDEMTAAVAKYKSDMAGLTTLIVTNVSREVRSEISARANDWNRQVNRGEKVDNETVAVAVTEILRDKLNAEINSQMRRVIEDFQSNELKTVKANISAAALEKQTAEISHTYTESYIVTRPPEGLWEEIRDLFGKIYYRREDKTRTQKQTIDLGTNLDELLDSLTPQVEQYAKTQAEATLAELREKYFVERENFARRMRGAIDKLRGELLALKF